MKKDTTKTRMVFLIEPFDGGVMAFMPDEKCSISNDLIRTSYAHIGQHSACHVDYCTQCRQASHEESEGLLMELVSLGYLPDVVLWENVRKEFNL